MTSRYKYSKKNKKERKKKKNKEWKQNEKKKGKLYSNHPNYKNKNGRTVGSSIAVSIVHSSHHVHQDNTIFIGCERERKE